MINNSLLNRRVLILNQNYQPISVAPAKRAIVLMFKGKIEVLENYSETVHSPTISMSLPSVIKLNYYVSFKRRDIVLSRRNILKRDGYTCQYCGTHSIPMTIDHVIPKRNGGKDTWENLTTACIKCNLKKGNRTPKESKMPLVRKPKKPTMITFFQKFVKKYQDTWRPYLFMDPKEIN